MSVRPHIAGERISLRPVEVGDVGDDYHSWMNDPEITRYLESRFTSYSKDDLRQYVQSMANRDDVLFLAIIRRSDNRHIGNIKLGPIHPVHRLADIGILIGDRTAWGKGFATEAIRLLADYAFRVLDLHKITAGCYASNEASARAFARAGFVEEGRRRAHTMSEGAWVDNILLGMVRPEVAA